MCSSLPSSCSAPYHLPAQLRTIFLFSFLPSSCSAFSFLPFSCWAPNHLPSQLRTIFLFSFLPSSCSASYHPPFQLLTIFLFSSLPSSCSASDHLPVNFLRIFDSKKFVVRFRFYWRPPEGFYFHWRGFKKCFLQFKTLRRLIYIQLEVFRCPS